VLLTLYVSLLYDTHDEDSSRDLGMHLVVPYPSKEPTLEIQTNNRDKTIISFITYLTDIYILKYQAYR